MVLKFCQFLAINVAVFSILNQSHDLSDNFTLIFGRMQYSYEGSWKVVIQLEPYDILFTILRKYFCFHIQIYVLLFVGILELGRKLSRWIYKALPDSTDWYGW